MTLHIEDMALRLAESLDYGQVTRLECPSCHGGKSHEISFGVGREPDRVWWNCFRASCNERGVTGSHTIAPAERDNRLGRLKPYYHDIHRPEPKDYEYFRGRFDLTPDTVTASIRVTSRDEYILPYRGPDRALRGHVVRQPWWSGYPGFVRKGRQDENASRIGPKTKTYPSTTQPTIAWYMSQHHWGHVVIVEDQISAMRVAQAGITCVALLGVGMNLESVRDIAREKPKVVTLALDPDAQGQAQAIAKKWGMYWERVRVVGLEADPKDVGYDSLLEELAL